MKKLILALSAVAVLLIMIIMELGPEERPEEQTHRAGILMVGNSTDSSWNEAHYIGINKAAQNLNMELYYEENLTPENCGEAIDRLLKQGCNIIISTSFSFENTVKDVAFRHRDVYFLQATGTAVQPNLNPYMGRMYQARYLAGIVAGKNSRNGAVGYVAPVPIPEVIRGIDAFTLGVRYANPRAFVYVTYTDSWGDAQKARDVTEKLLQKVPEIDVLSMHTDSYIPIQVAREHGIQAIGCNTCRQRDEDVLLTGAVWNWDKLYEKYLREAVQGRLSGRSYLAGIETGIVGLAPLSPRCTEETFNLVEQVKMQLVNGTRGVFYGPVRDTEGKLRVGEGENLPDTVLFEQLDWYVEGVQLP